MAAETRFVVGRNKQTNSMAFSPQAKYTDWAAAICVPTFVDRGVSRG
jgi:hypothetical protein